MAKNTKSEITVWKKKATSQRGLRSPLRAGGAVPSSPGLVACLLCECSNALQQGDVFQLASVPRLPHDRASFFFFLWPLSGRGWLVLLCAGYLLGTPGKTCSRRAAVISEVAQPGRPPTPLLPLAFQLFSDRETYSGVILRRVLLKRSVQLGHAFALICARQNLHTDHTDEHSDTCVEVKKKWY